MPDMTVDRAAVRRMVEDFWRLLLLSGRNLSQLHPTATPQNTSAAQDMARDLSRRFEQRCQATASLMPPEQRKIFLQMIEEEDSICFNELQTNGDALYRRLGIGDTASASPAPTPVAHHRQRLGEMAVRTAVRATVWELIWSLFRR
jgi:hypothetical protein